MYTNENKFSFRDVVFQFLFVALFIFILLLLFPTKNYLSDMKSELLENTSDSSEGTSKIVTSAIFNQNITTMKEAAILYFTTPRLPSKVGDSVDLSLKELLDKHLMVAPLDEKGQVCDTTKSYITMTKKKDEYVLKVNLKCGSEEDYIITYLGCYDYCQGTICESKATAKPSKKVEVPKTPSKPVNLSYQYEYKLNGKWSNWSSWSTWTTTLQTATTSKDVEVKVEKTEDRKEVKDAKVNITYVCPAGYTLSNGKCIKSTEEMVTATVIKKYSCPDGYTLSGGVCKKGKKYTTEATRKVTYSCPSGYALSGNICHKTTTTTIDATKTITYSCDGDYVLSGTTCVRNVTTVTRQTFTSERSGSEYKLVNVDTRAACTGCAYVTYYTYDVTTTSQSSKAASVSTQYSCAGLSGYTLSGTKCIKTDDTTAAASTTTSDYSCPDSDYKLSGTTCTKQVIYTVEPNTNISYECKDGYNLVEGVCVKGSVSKIDATQNKKYSCEAGYTLSGTKCEKTIQGVKTTYYRYRTRTYIPGDIQWRDTKTDKTLLSKGYYLTGNKRVKK